MRNPEDTKYVWDKQNFNIIEKSIMKYKEKRTEEIARELVLLAAEALSLADAYAGKGQSEPLAELSEQLEAFDAELGALNKGDTNAN